MDRPHPVQKGVADDGSGVQTKSCPMIRTTTMPALSVSAAAVSQNSTRTEPITVNGAAGTTASLGATFVKGSVDS